MLLPTQLTQWHQRVEGFCATAIQLLGTNNLKPHSPWPWHEGQDPGRSGKTHGVKMEKALLFQKCPLAPPGHIWHNISRQNAPVMLCSLPLTPLSGPGTMSLSTPHRATARCCAGRETESRPLYPSHPAQPLGMGQCRKRLYFLGRSLLLGHWEHSSSILLGISPVHGQGTALQPP